MSNTNIEVQGSLEFDHQQSLPRIKEWKPVEWDQANDLIKQGLNALDILKVFPKFSPAESDRYVYIDKTDVLLDLIKNHENVFLSRPRRMGKTTAVETLIEMSKTAYLESVDSNYKLPAVFQNTAFAQASLQQKQTIAAPYVVHLDFSRVLPDSYILIAAIKSNKQEQLDRLNCQEQAALASTEQNKQEQLDRLNCQEQAALASIEQNKQEQLDNIGTEMKCELASLQEKQTTELNSLKQSQSETKNKLDQLNQDVLDKSIQDGTGDFNEIILKWTESQFALTSVFQKQLNALVDIHKDQINSVQQKYSNKQVNIDTEYSILFNAIKQDYSAQRTVLDDEYASKVNAIKQDYSAQRTALDDEYASKINIINQDYSTQNVTLEKLKELFTYRLIAIFSEGLKESVLYNIKTARNLKLYDIDSRSSEILSYLESFNYEELSDLSITDAVFRLLNKMPEASIVLVIDEYDASIAATLKYQSYCQIIMSCFKEFYSALKGFHNKFKFSFITGVTSYQKVSLFSGANQFYDISFDTNFSNITGFTESELKKYFAPAICRLAVINNITPQQVLDLLKSFYDGYCFANPVALAIRNGQMARPEKIFNPVSVKSFLKQDSIEFKNYWILTGGGLTATIRSLLGFVFSVSEFVDMLSKAKNGLMTLANNEQLICLPAEVSKEALREALPVFLLQAGYLAIDYEKTTLSQIVLCIPNKEIEQYLVSEELNLFKFQYLKFNSSNNLLEQKTLLDLFLLDTLLSGNPQVIENKLYEFFMGAVSYSARDSLNESGWRDILYNVLKNTSKLDLMSNNIEIERERIELAGRSDLMITDESTKHRAVFEFKLLQSVKESSAKANKALNLALSQIKQRDYRVDSRYTLDRYACILNLIYTPHDHTFDKLQVEVRKLGF